MSISDICMALSAYSVPACATQPTVNNTYAESRTVSCWYMYTKLYSFPSNLGRLFLTPDNTTHFQAMRVFSATRRTMAGSNNKFISGLYHIKVHIYCMRADYYITITFASFAKTAKLLMQERAAQKHKESIPCAIMGLCAFMVYVQLATCTCVVECL